MTGSLITKIAIGGVAGATSITPVVFYFAPPWSLELTQEKFEEFKRTNNFDSCRTFLSNEDKRHLLFLCLSNSGEARVNRTVHHYFYNGGSWEKALSLEKDPNNQSAGFFLVRTQTWWGQGRRKINNSDETQPNQLTEHNRLGMKCTFQTSEVTSNSFANKNFVCFKDKREYKLEWPLKELNF